MIDIHSHILPNIDDGASSLAEAFTMLKMAVDNGVTTQVLTPHIHHGRFDNTKQGITEKFEQFSAEVDKENIPIKLLLGAELRIGSEVMAMINNNQVPWLGECQGQNTFLLEFPRNDIPFGSDNLVRWVLSKNCLPIIVHPERNTTFMKNPAKLQVFLDLGCPIQLTSCSLTGKFGAEVQAFSEQLLIDEKVSAIASDCHNLKGRKPDLLAGFEHAKAIVGEQKASTLVNLIPNTLIHNNPYHL
jgi:protein-tyrosine phosphatase